MQLLEDDPSRNVVRRQSVLPELLLASDCAPKDQGIFCQNGFDVSAKLMEWISPEAVQHDHSRLVATLGLISGTPCAFDFALAGLRAGYAFQ